MTWFAIFDPETGELSVAESPATHGADTDAGAVAALRCHLVDTALPAALARVTEINRRIGACLDWESRRG